jgi:hypothetical protein
MACLFHPDPNNNECLGNLFKERLNGMLASPWKQISQSLVSTHGPSQAKVGMTPRITSRNCLLSILGKWVQSFFDIIRQERLAHPQAILKFVDPGRCTWRYQQLLVSTSPLYQ